MTNLTKNLEYLLSGPPFVILLLGTGIFFTFYLKFPQIRFFLKSIKLLLGIEKRERSQGDTSPLQALATSLGGSIGVGCIAGTGVAMNIGGPSSIFWMLVTTFFAMATKYVEVTLCHKYREKSKDGTMSGSPMYFIKNKLKMPWLATIMGIATILYASAFVNMPQANSICKALYQTFHIKEIISGAVMSLLVGFIIFGGITRISRVAEKLIPFMSFLYLVISLMVIFKFAHNILPSLKLIFMNPLKGSSALGGFLGSGIALTIKEGVNRSYYTNDAGSGTSGIVHASSKEENSFNEGVLALIEPFFCTAIMCTLTGLVILVSGTWNTKFENKFDNSDLIILQGKYSDKVKSDTDKLRKHLNDEINIPKYNDILNIENGKIKNDQITIINLNSVAENITLFKDDKPYTGKINIVSGKISIKNHNIKFIGKSLVTGVIPATIAFKFSPIGKWGPYIMNLCMVLFALTTVLTWFYYGDRGLVYFGAGKKILFLYKIIFIIVFFLGSLISASLVWTLIIIAYACMGIPNLIGLILMRKEIKKITSSQGK